MQIKVSGTGAPYITITDATYIDTIVSLHNFNDTGTGSSDISTMVQVILVLLLILVVVCVVSIGQY